MTKTYEISLDDKGNEGIKCLDCGLTSYHPMDIKEKYCGNCHEFHEEKARRKGVANMERKFELTQEKNVLQVYDMIMKSREMEADFDKKFNKGWTMRFMKVLEFLQIPFVIVGLILFFAEPIIIAAFGASSFWHGLSRFFQAYAVGSALVYFIGGKKNFMQHDHDFGIMSARQRPWEDDIIKQAEAILKKDTPKKN